MTRQDREQIVAGRYLQVVGAAVQFRFGRNGGQDEGFLGGHRCGRFRRLRGFDGICSDRLHVVNLRGGGGGIEGFIRAGTISLREEPAEQQDHSKKRGGQNGDNPFCGCRLPFPSRLRWSVPERFICPVEAVRACLILCIGAFSGAALLAVCLQVPAQLPDGLVAILRGEGAGFHDDRL